MYARSYLTLFFLLFCSCTVFAQDITGLWKGSLYNDSTKLFYRYEIGISEEKGKLSGFSHTFFLSDNREYYGVKKLKIRKAGDKIIIEDAGLIANNYPEAPAKAVRQLNILTLDIKDSIMVLSGPFTTNRTKEYSPLTGTVSLQRKNDFWQSALVPHLQELGLTNNLSFVKADNERIAKIETQLAAATARENEKATSKINIEPGKNNQATLNTVPVKEDVDEKTVASVPKKEKVNDASKNNIPSNVIEKNSSTKAGAVNKKRTSENNTGNYELAKQAEEKKKTSSQEKTLPIAPAAEVELRETILQQTVYFSSDSLELSLYDNGEVDGDTVSVLMNGKIIMAKEGLSTKAVRKIIYVDPALDSIELVMYAENLGTIAPNTGLLVVHDGKNIYEIRFSGDLQKNAAIILKRKK